MAIDNYHTSIQRLLQAKIDEVKRLRDALTEIANRRHVMSPARNEYDTGYTLGTELCCDIADQALEE